MLTKVLGIEGVGLLRDVRGGNSNHFGKLTLLYAENGRGKSTFASVLTSCTARDSDLIEDRVMNRPGFDGGSRVTDGEWIHAPT